MNLEFNCEKFAGRVSGLAELYWPGAVQLMQLSVKGESSSNLKLIASANIESITGK